MVYLSLMMERKYGMERAFEKYLREVEQLKFMKKIGYHRFCRTI